MKAFRFFIGIWIFTIVHGFFGWNSEKDTVVVNTPTEQMEKKILPEHICIFHYPSMYGTSNTLILHYPPARKPRRGMTPKDLAHAHLLVTYRECDCFNPTTTEGWTYLQTCLRYFSDLEKKYKELLEIKNQM
jgi:hypothetical protein